MKPVILDSIPFSVSIDDLVERIGGNGDKISSRLQNQADEALQELKDHAQTRALYQLVQCENDACFDDEMFYNSRKVSRVFEDCDKAAVFLITLGRQVDELIEKTIQDCPAYGFILDTAASLAAESAAENIENIIEDRLPREEGMTERYSPGYCDWPLKGQKNLFDIIPYEKLDVQLNDNYSMIPRKSVSGIIGICPANSADASGNACRFCGKTDCPYRRI